jgi:MFS family permease
MAVERDPAEAVGAAVRWLARASGRALTSALGGAERTRVIVLLAAVLALSSADASTVGASAMPLRRALGISNTDIGLLVTATSLVAALASLPFGVLADRVGRTRTLGIAIVLWGGAMIWSATAATFDQLLVTRLVLEGVTAAAGPIVASLVGDYFGVD